LPVHRGKILLDVTVADAAPTITPAEKNQGHAAACPCVVNLSVSGGSG
jgi:hypothetical protein